MQTRIPSCWTLRIALISLFCLATERSSQLYGQAAPREAGGLIDGVLIDDVGKTEAPISTTESFLEPGIAKWEADIAKLEELDQQQIDPADAVLFLGSSSIRRWTSIQQDMAPFRTIRRGYGGAKYNDLAYYAPRLIHPHSYRAVALFVGNDVAGKETDHTPDEVEVWVKQILDLSRTHQPHAAILIIEVTPTPRRIEAWPKIRALNARLREIALTEPNVFLVPTAGHFLNADKQPREDLFVEDQLHLNARGYALWASLIRRRLSEVMRLLENS